MEDIAALKLDRVLHIYFKLIRGESLDKRVLAQEFHVTERSIQRDLAALRCFLTEQNMGQDIVYDKNVGGYHIQNMSQGTLSNSEILAVCKILLESRSMRRDELLPILDKLIACCVPEQNKKAVRILIANEEYHYIEPQHGKHILNGLWEIGQAIQNHQVMEIRYERLKEPRLVTRKVEPVGIMFSEYYFYLMAFLQDIDRETEFKSADDVFPTIYRIDRIRSFKVMDERFRVPYKIVLRRENFENEYNLCMAGS